MKGVNEKHEYLTRAFLRGVLSLDQAPHPPPPQTLAGQITTSGLVHCTCLQPLARDPASLLANRFFG